MAIRNWWIEVEIDGRKHKLAGGPRAKDGGFQLEIHQRHGKTVIFAADIQGAVLDNGELRLVSNLVVDGQRSVKQYTHATKR